MNRRDGDNHRGNGDHHHGFSENGRFGRNIMIPPDPGPAFNRVQTNFYSPVSLAEAFLALAAPTSFSLQRVL